MVEATSTTTTVPAEEQAEAAFLRYAEVMNTKGANTTDELVNAWCAAEQGALQTLADLPATSLRDFLRKTALVTARVDHDGHWNILEAEAELLMSVAQEARAILDTMEPEADRALTEKCEAWSKADAAAVEFYEANVFDVASEQAHEAEWSTLDAARNALADEVVSIPAQTVAGLQAKARAALAAHPAFMGGEWRDGFLEEGNRGIAAVLRDLLEFRA